MASEPVIGLWRAPGHARAVQALLWIAADGTATVAAADGDPVLATAFIAEIGISDRVGSIPRHLTFPDGSDFETGDNEGIDRLLAPHVGAHAGLIPGLERFRPRLLVFVAVALALCFAIYRYAMPVLVEVAVAVTPPVVNDLMSQSVMASLDGTVFDKTGLSPERQKSLSDGFAAIAALTPRGKAASAPRAAAFTLNFRKGGAIGPNAFALPDGTVVLTDELVDLANDDDELILAVLAHEIGHVERQHSLRQLYRAVGATALIMLIGGDIGSGTEDVLVQGSALVTLSYSREAEAEADRYSVDLMHKAGKDPAAIARFFELLRDRLGDSGKGDFFSTHPATEKRIEDARRYAGQVAGQTQ